MSPPFLAIVVWVLLIAGANHAAFAQDSQAATAAEPNKTYAFFKSMEKKPPWSTHDLKGDELNLGLVVCGYNVDRLFGPQSAGLMALLDHAKRVSDLESMLAVFPRELWEKDLKDFEDRTVANIIDDQDPIGAEYRLLAPFLDKMIANLNSFREANPSFPPVVNKGECGSAGAVLVDVITIPNARRVQFIGYYYFELCKAQGYDPLDTAKCNRWTDLGGDINKSIFAGRVKFLVTWPDGQRAGPYDMDVDIIPDVQGGRRFTIRE